MNPDFDLMAPMAVLPRIYRNNQGPLTAPLVPAGDKLIAVSGPKIFAFDVHSDQLAETATGQAWFVNLEDPDGGDANVAAANGVVYLMDGDSLRAVGLGDAKTIPTWPKKDPQVPGCNRLIVQDGRLVAVSLDARGATLIRGFDPLTGELKFGPYKRNDKSAGKLACGAKAVFFVASGEFVALNTDFGDKRWGFKPAGDKLDGSSEPLITPKVALVAGASLHGVDVTSGAPLYKIGATPGSAGHWYTPVADIPNAAAAATQAANLQVVRPLLGAASGAHLLQASLARVAGGIAVAVHAGGDVVGFNLADGQEKWRKHFQLPGPPVLINGVVYLTTEQGQTMRQLKAEDGSAAGMPFDLAGRSEARPSVIANGSLFSVNEAGDVEARTFAVQHAAYFDGKSSHIKVLEASGQYDFGTGDFTVEAWFRSSTGGEIISSYPTNADPDAHGFRLRLEEGQVRVAVLNRDGSSLHVGRTSDIGVDDGQWHHVAFVRRSGEFLIVLDGVSQVVNLADEKGRSLTIGGQSALTIGAFIFPGVPARGFFRGLLREVRVWDHAVDVVNIAANREVELTGMEPRLKGLWRLDADLTGADKKAPQNEAHRSLKGAEFVNPASRATDLTMDHTAFPYLLHEPREQWPYAGTWGARGEDEAVGSPALSNDGVIAFGTDNAIYAVDAHDGHRFWGMDVGRNTSGPVADGGSFLVMTNDDALIRVDSRNGGKLQVEAFAFLPNPGDAKCPNPAATREFIAAATGGDSPTVAIWDRASPQAVSRQLAGAVQRLEIGEAGLAVLTQAGDGTRTLSLLARDTAALLGQRAVATDVFCTAGAWVLTAGNHTVIRLPGANLGGPPAATSAVLDGAITGLVASPDHDMLVATTANGTVHRLMLGTLATMWSKTVPLGPVAGQKALNPPVIDSGGRIVCTSASGTVAVFDDDTGGLMGLYDMDHSPLDRPATAAGGTLYTACADPITPGADDHRDGALHALLLGDTVALRLNLDERGHGTAGAQHAVVDVPTSEATLHLLQVQDSCVEAWINAPLLPAAGGVPSGGGILSIVASAESEFDIHLWLDADGTLHYASRVQDKGGAWHGLHHTAATSLLDGAWHHVAVSRMLADRDTDNATDRVIIYIDGQAVPSARQDTLGAPPKTTPGLRAHIGACAAPDLTATLPFHGLIAEVRVWDNYMVASEIASRMHVKLRGDEADLLAYWNFDHGMVHDSAVQGHDGALALPVSTPAWWLVDLPFTQPSYPHVATAARISDEAGDTSSYQLTLKVLAADGTGMAEQDVHLWYVRRHADDPATITIGEKEIQGVSSADEPHPLLMASQLAKAWKGTTLSDGTLPVTVIATGAGSRGPALDLWTEFMPLNERFHVNVLLDNQKLAKPAPPKLTAQAKLIQDYHYTTGNKVDHTRDRSTWRTVIRAASASDQPRGFEPITLWASEPLSFEVNSKSYAVTKDNAVTLTAEASGELTLVMDAAALTAPTLYARAGFMHRDDRIVINPDQDAHAQLAKVSNDDLTQQRVTNWKRPEDAKPSDADSLLPANARSEAPKVATAVRQVAAAVKPADPNAPPKSLKLTPARAKLLALRNLDEAEQGQLLKAGQANAWRQPRLAAMKQAQPQPRADEVVPRRTLAGMASLPPVDAEALRAELGTALGFCFEKTGPNRVSYTPLTTQDEVDAARGLPTPVLLHQPMLGGLFDNIWGGIKDAANKVAETVTKVVVTIADTVQLAITKMVDGIQKIVHTVVSSVKDALNAIGSFFEQIGAAIAKVIAFLRALFDWGNIIKTHNILRDIVNASLTISSSNLKNTGPFVNQMRSLAGLPPTLDFKGGQSLNASVQSAPDKESSIAASANSVQAKSMTQKTQTTPARSVGPTAEAPDIGGKAEGPFDVIARSVPRLAGAVLDLSPTDLFAQLSEIGKAMGAQALVAAAGSIAELMGTLATTVDWTRQVLNTTINIPFISELYKWITGSDLTLLSVLCLAAAIPVNLAYAIVTLAQGGARFFFDDGKHIAADMLAHASGQRLRAGAPAAGPVAPPRTPGGPEFLVILYRALAQGADLMADASFSQSHGQGRERTPAEMGSLAMVNIFQGLVGGMALTLQTFMTRLAFEDRIRAVAGKDAADFLPEYEALVDALFGIGIALRVNKMRAGAMFFIKGPAASSGALSRFKDKYEYPVALCVSAAMIDVLTYQICQLAIHYPKLQKHGNSQVADQYRYLALRDILGIVPLLFEFMYTVEGAQAFRRKFGNAAGHWYTAATATRSAAGAASIVMHGIAAYRYGDIG